MFESVEEASLPRGPNPFRPISNHGAEHPLPLPHAIGVERRQNKATDPVAERTTASVCAPLESYSIRSATPLTGLSR